MLGEGDQPDDDRWPTLGIAVASLNLMCTRAGSDCGVGQPRMSSRRPGRFPIRGVRTGQDPCVRGSHLRMGRKIACSLAQSWLPPQAEQSRTAEPPSKIEARPRSTGVGIRTPMSITRSVSGQRIAIDSSWLQAPAGLSLISLGSAGRGAHASVFRPARAAIAGAAGVVSPIDKRSRRHARRVHPAMIETPTHAASPSAETACSWTLPTLGG